jgi:hypothetical protein
MEYSATGTLENSLGQTVSATFEPGFASTEGPNCTEVFLFQESSAATALTINYQAYNLSPLTMLTFFLRVDDQPTAERAIMKLDRMTIYQNADTVYALYDDEAGRVVPPTAIPVTVPTGTWFPVKVAIDLIGGIFGADYVYYIAGVGAPAPSKTSDASTLLFSGDSHDLVVFPFNGAIALVEFDAVYNDAPPLDIDADCSTNQGPTPTILDFETMFCEVEDASSCSVFSFNGLDYSQDDEHIATVTPYHVS